MYISKNKRERKIVSLMYGKVLQTKLSTLVQHALRIGDTTPASYRCRPNQSNKERKPYHHGLRTLCIVP